MEYDEIIGYDSEEDKIKDEESRRDRYEEYKEYLMFVYKNVDFDEFRQELANVPAEFWGFGIAEFLVENWPSTITKYIPTEFVTERIWEIALSKCGEMLEEVPREMINEKLCEIAVSNEPTAIWHVPEELRSEKIYEIMAEQEPEMIFSIPEDKKTDRVRKIEKELRVKQESEREEQEFVAEIEEFKIKCGKSEMTLEEVKEEVHKAKTKLEKLEKMLHEHGIDMSDGREGNGHE